MKKLDPKFYIRQLPVSNMLQRAPRPFPGRWPTRLIVRARWRKRGTQDAYQEFNYFGKPSKNITQWVNVLVLNSRLEGKVSYCEVDLAGPIADGTRNIFHAAGIEACSTGHWNEKLFHFYHPWTWQSLGSLQTFHIPFFSKRIKFKGKIYTVYSRQQKLKIEDHVRPFKTWLEKSGVIGEAQGNGVRGY